jgi:FKBP-type peptidyl-prolyl cis-trans isomerase
VRPIIALALSSLVLASLTACSSASSNDTSCTPLAKSGSSVDQVSLTQGSSGARPDLVFPTPLTVTETQRKIIKEGTGAVAQPGMPVSVEYRVYNGDTGKVLFSTDYSGTAPDSLVLDSNNLPGLVKTVQCAKVGSRIVSVMSAADIKSADGKTLSNLPPTTNLVATVDLVGTSLAKANGKDQPPQAGFPTVVLDDSGIPGITVPKTAAPTDLKVAVLKKGDGPTVAAESTVTINYTGVLWADNSVFDSSFLRRSPITMQVNRFVPGFAQALEGQTVGSQVIMVIPPALGYGTQASDSIPANSTLVFVVDILNTTP